VKLATTFFLALTMFPLAHSQDENQKQKQISLPTSKVLHVPTPGWLGSLNSFPATVALSPDGKFAAFLNDGYGTQKALARQSISILNLGNNEITDFPDDRFPEDAKQSYFIGLSFSSDGAHLYASVGSISDPMGAKRGNLGNGIAVYTFEAGKVTPERFIRIAPQRLAAGNRVARGLRKAPAGTAIPYPAGLAVVSGETGDKLLVANNLSDSVILLDARSGEVSSQFDLGTNKLVPSSFPYGVIASRDGKRAWVSLWNASKLVEGKCRKLDSTACAARSEEPWFTPDRTHAESRRASPLRRVVECRPGGSAIDRSPERDRHVRHQTSGPEGKRDISDRPGLV